MAAVEEKPTRATAVSEWKREEVELVRLPSGNSASLQRPQLSGMIRRGEIPNPLIQAVASMEVGQLPDDFAQAVELTDLLVSLAFVEPRVSIEEVPGPGELSIDAVSDQDKTYVAAWVKRDAAAMATFRIEQGGTGDGEGGGEVRDAA